MKWNVEKQILLCIPFPQMHNDGGRLCQSEQSWVLKDWLRMHLHQPCLNELGWEIWFSWGEQTYAAFTKRWARFAALLFFLSSASVTLDAAATQANLLFICFVGFTKCSMKPQLEQLNVVVPTPFWGRTSLTSPSVTIWKVSSSEEAFRMRGKTSPRSQEQVQLPQLNSSNSTYLPSKQVVSIKILLCCGAAFLYLKVWDTNSTSHPPNQTTGACHHTWKAASIPALSWNTTPMQNYVCLCLLFDLNPAKWRRVLSLLKNCARRLLCCSFCLFLCRFLLYFSI